MAQQLFSREIAGLVGNAGGEAAPALLRQASELFVAEPGHSRNEIAMFEELCAQLFKVTPLGDRLEIATLLAGYREVPASVTRALLHDIYPVAAAFLEKAPAIADVELLAMIAAAPQSHLELVAARRNLTPVVVEALLNKMPPRSLPILLANPTIRLPATAIDTLVDLARDEPAIATALAGRLDDVEDTDLIDLFLLLDGRGRRRVIQALEIAALRAFAARRPQPNVPLPPTEAIAELARACLFRDTPTMAAALAGILGVPTELASTLITDAGGEPLAVALKAAGLDLAITTRVLLFSGETESRTYFEIKRLIELYESVSLRSAVLLAERWRGRAPTLRPSHAHYVPQSEAGTPVRTPAAMARHLPAASGERRESA